jgi:hypothetical protein
MPGPRRREVPVAQGAVPDRRLLLPTPPAYREPGRPREGRRGWARDRFVVEWSCRKGMVSQVTLQATAEAAPPAMLTRTRQLRCRPPLIRASGRR